MRNVRLNFNKVSLTFTKSGNCSVCGGKATRSKVFWQTLNPFNTNTSGTVKTVKEIRDELRIQGEQWKEIPVTHAKCE